jgi:hypothetical protein
VKTTAKVLAAYRADANHRDAHERLAEVDPEEFLALLDDLDELRECLRLMYEDTTRFDDNNDQALQARIAAALKEPHAS